MIGLMFCCDGGDFMAGPSLSNQQDSEGLLLQQGHRHYPCPVAAGLENETAAACNFAAGKFRVEREGKQLWGG